MVARAPVIGANTTAGTPQVEEVRGLVAAMAGALPCWAMSPITDPPTATKARKITTKQMGDACEMLVAAELTLAGVPAQKMPDN